MSLKTFLAGINMDRSAVILAGGFSSRFGQDKSLLDFKGKPLIQHVVDAVKQVVNEIIVVTSTQERADKYAKQLGSKIKFVLDVDEGKGPLIGALTGFKYATGKYSLLLPADLPFVSPDIVELLFDLSSGRSAVVPRWPNAQVEPLHAVYNTKIALDAAQIAVSEGKYKVVDMLENMQGIRYVSTLVIQTLDPELKTFFNVNTPIDLKKAQVLSKPKPQKKSK